MTAGGSPADGPAADPLQWPRGGVGAHGGAPGTAVRPAAGVVKMPGTQRRQLARSGRDRRRGLAIVPLCGLLVLGSIAAGFGRVAAAPGQGPKGAGMTVALAPGDSRADPVPFKQEAQAGPWQIAVTDVVTGQAATTQVTQASKFNAAPRDAATYVLVKIRAKNTGTQPLQIGGDDFGVTASDGIVHRFVGAFPPDPALDATVKPGESQEGWVVLGAASDAKNLLLIFDPLSLPGNWADRVFALEANAKVPDATAPAAKPDAAGKALAQAVALNTPVTTADWQVQIVKVLSGMDVYNLYPSSDYRTTALGQDQAPAWTAIQVKATNVRTGGDAAFFPPTAFHLVDEKGNVVPDVEWLTPPDPDVSGWYYPSASRTGWVVFEVPDGYSADVVRFLPFSTDSDPRYLTYGGGAPAPSSTATANTQPIPPGTTVKVTDDGVHLRNQPSTNGAVVATLAAGTTLKVTGAPQQGNGYTWYPVTNPGTGDSGYIAADFIKPA